MRRTIAVAALLALVSALAATAPAEARGAPVVDQLVVFRHGAFKQTRVRAGTTRVRVGRKTCTLGQGTPLAALVRSRAGKLTLHDFGSCSRRPADASGLFVRRIGGDANRGVDGWVYKVGTRTGSAGAGDISGPFGHGLLKSGARVLWFYCHMSGSSCQRTLTITSVRQGPGGALTVRVRAYDDRGRGIPAQGVTVHAGRTSAQTSPAGVARLTASAGGRALWADGGGYVRSFTTKVAVR